MVGDRYTIKEFEDKRQYIFDKLIFSISILILLCIFFLFVFLNGGLNAEKHIYVNCESAVTYSYLNGTSANYCKNPLYKEYAYCNNVWVGACEQEFLPQGFVYGTPPPKWFLSFNLIVFVILIIAFAINHLIHNRKF